MPHLPKLLYLLLCTAIVAYGTLTGGEANLIAIILLVVLSAPLGIIPVLIASYTTEYIVKVFPLASEGIHFLTLFAIIYCGYYQWFVFAPKAFKYLTKR